MASEHESDVPFLAAVLCLAYMLIDDKVKRPRTHTIKEK